MDVGNDAFQLPLLRPTDFYQHIADLGKLSILTGGQEPASCDLPAFWQRFEAIEPANTIFEAFRGGALSPARTIPMLLHGDEGRAKKRSPVMIVNTHGLIGAGCRAFEEWHRDTPTLRQQSMPVNLKGSSMATRFLAFVCPKSAYGPDSEYLNKMFDELVLDLVKLQTDGVTMSGETWHLAFVGTVGDLQFFTKIADLNRSYNHVSKKSGQKTLVGVCHLCLGGLPGCSFEDFSDSPCWLPSVGLVDPWEVPPTLVRELHVNTDNPAGFLKPDIWHCFHLGAGKTFLSSAIAEWLPFVPGTWDL